MAVANLTLQKFQRYRAVFEQEVNKQPVEANIILAVIADSTGFTGFTGDKTPTYIDKVVKCLYKRDFSPFERTKFGLKDEVTGVLYIPPNNLIAAFGTWKLAETKIKVLLYGDTYGVGYVRFNGPMYDSCISVEYRLIDYADM